METKNISIDDIVEPEDELRSEASQEGIIELSRSISQYGIIEPLVVKQSGEKHKIVCGSRRFAAAKLARLAVVPCVITSANDKEADVLTLHENFVREDVNAVDESIFFRRMMERHNIDISALAEIIHKSDGYVRERMEIKNWPLNLCEALRSKQINFSVAKVLSGFKDPGSLKYFTGLAIENGLTVKTLLGFRTEYDKKVASTNTDPSVVAQEMVSPDYKLPPRLCDGCGTNLDGTPIKFPQLCVNCYRAFMSAVSDPPPPPVEKE